MKLIPEAEFNLVGDIYDASLEAGLWHTVIDRYAALMRADQANILAFDKLNPDYFLFYAHGSKPEALELYQAGGFADLDLEFAGRWMASQGALDRAVANHHHFGGIENYMREAGRLYTDFFAKVDILYQCGMLLEKTDFRWSVLGTHRGHAGAAFEDDRVDTATRLLPHLRRALQIHRQLILANQKHARLYRLLDGLRVGVLLLDGRSHVRYANAVTEQLLAHHDGLRVGTVHEIAARDPQCQAELKSLIRGTVQASNRESGEIAPGGVMACADTRGDGLLMLTVIPLSEMSGYEELGSDGITTAIFLTDPHGRHDLAAHILKSSFGLTDREAELCEAFVNHATLEGVAAACDLSLATVRTYMRDIYEKTGERSQAELMRLLMGLRVNFEHIR